MILDSTFVHDVLRNDSDAIEQLVELRDSETPVALSTLTVFEVGVGLRGESAQYRAEFDERIDELVVLPVTETVARRAIAIQHDLLDQGQRIGARDVLIAGIAVGSPDPRVLTRNVDEFARVDGLDVNGY
ncbi:tRNA(fMet)-specific endonuclease VapC [Halalkalicoccus paucihalophilus]|uniref:Ribonuclease VapC n=1 Tax=Halalkalicoccus paucihalophilus TaxID=1008153 RepID=A0A151A8E1_9EURY|nr:PIN domain-containing protein [Halalkalicoccus paucihalophilus]KYH23762.1 tRNA(fMet)-specific endonuclease VapC [Halalkalicoccus paucihalophilus]